MSSCDGVAGGYLFSLQQAGEILQSWTWCCFLWLSQGPLDKHTQKLPEIQTSPLLVHNMAAVFSLIWSSAGVISVWVCVCTCGCMQPTEGALIGHSDHRQVWNPPLTFAKSLSDAVTCRNTLSKALMHWPPFNPLCRLSWISLYAALLLQDVCEQDLPRSWNLYFMLGISKLFLHIHGFMWHVLRSKGNSGKEEGLGWSGMCFKKILSVSSYPSGFPPRSLECSFSPFFTFSITLHLFHVFDSPCSLVILN